MKKFVVENDGTEVARVTTFAEADALAGRRAAEVPGAKGTLTRCVTSFAEGEARYYLGEGEAEKARAAVSALLEKGAEFSVGYVVFDPCAYSEVAENAWFNVYPDYVDPNEGRGTWWGEL